MVPDLFTLGFAVAVAVIVATTLVLILDSSYRTSIVDWWYGDREAWWEKKNRHSMSISASPCAVCGKPCTLRCGKCKLTKYCSQECQRQHWRQGHRKECKTAALQEVQNDRLPAKDTNNEPEVSLTPRQVLHPYNNFLKFFRDADVFERDVPVGLRNLGNTCFANSLLQCLLHTRGLASYLRSRTHSKNCIKPSKHSFCLLCSMETLMCEYWDADPQESIAPKQLMNRLPKIAKHMVLGRQEDAHEFYVHLVDVMEAIMLLEAGGKEQYDQRTRETTFVHHLFGGYVRNQIVCDECGRESRTFESTMQLELAISAGTDSIEAALKRHFSDEILDGDNKYQCEKCKKKVRAVRGQRLEVAPNVLVICLKRFDSGSYFFKNNKPVRYKDHLDIGPYLAKDSTDDPATCQYQLHGVVMHLDFMNSTGSGHYLSYVSADGHHWFQCNDSVVRQINKEKALDPRAYMLFYTRQTPHAGPKPGPPQPLSKLPSTKLDTQKVGNGPCCQADDTSDSAGPQSHPIPSTERRPLSPPPCHTPSPTNPGSAAMSFDTALPDSSGDESASCDTRVAAPDTSEVSSRPLQGTISSTSDSTDEDISNGYLPYCVKEGTLGQPGVVRLLLNLGPGDYRANDVQVAMSSTNHIVVHVPSRVPLDLDMGDGIVIDKLECAIVRKRNRLKITCTLTAAHTPAPETERETPALEKQRETPAPEPHSHPCESSSLPSPDTPSLPSAPTPLEPAASAQLHPLSSHTDLDDTLSETDDVSTFDQTGGLYHVIAQLPTSPSSVCGVDSEKDATTQDCWSWPASVGSECESLDLFRHSHRSAPLENDQSNSSCNSMLGAHPLSSAAASESPNDSDHPSPVEETSNTTYDASTLVGKKRRIKQHNQAPSNSPSEPQSPSLDPSPSPTSIGSLTASRAHGNHHVAGNLHGQGILQQTKGAGIGAVHVHGNHVPATPTRTAPLTGTTIEVAIGPKSSMQGLVRDADALSVASDSDTSQEKSTDDSVGPSEDVVKGSGEKAAPMAGKGNVKKPKHKTGKTKGKKKKARKH